MTLRSRDRLSLFATPTASRAATPSLGLRRVPARVSMGVGSGLFSVCAVAVALTCSGTLLVPFSPLVPGFRPQKSEFRPVICDLGYDRTHSY
eukprot:2370402-Rhodomonas_salina.5